MSSVVRLLKQTKVVTYQSSREANTNVCRACEAHFERIRWWPKDTCGEEFCRVTHGEHDGFCSYCPDGSGAMVPEEEEDEGSVRAHGAPYGDGGVIIGNARSQRGAKCVASRHLQRGQWATWRGERFEPGVRR